MNNKNNKLSFISILRDFIARYPKYFGVLFFLLVMEGIIASMSILALIPLADFLLDSTLKSPNQITLTVVTLFHNLSIHPNFWSFGLLFVGLNLLKSLTEIAIRYASLRIKYAMLEDLMAETLKFFFAARWNFFSDSSHGDLMSSINREVPNIGDSFSAITFLLAQIVQLMAYTIVPMWISPVMTSCALLMALLFGAPFMLLRNISYRLGESNTISSSKHTSTLNEILSASRLVIGFGCQSKSIARYVGDFSHHVHITLRSQVLSTAIPKLYTPLAMLAVVLAMGVAVLQQTQIPIIAAVMWSLLAAMPILSNIVQGNIGISNLLPSYQQLLSLRNRAEKLQELHGKNIFSQLKKGINLTSVFFSYPGKNETLSDINIDIKKGQMVALVGKSGSGKSTITDLILGLQIPDRGLINLDGFPLNEWDLNSFRDRIGYVPQDPMLFNGTIRENLLWANSSASDDDLWQALSLSNSESFVLEMPKGIDTIVGDRGLRLSGGQRQRIALARALIRKPDLLILDEATSSLDTKSERLIQESIDQVSNGTTVLVIAHRLSTIAKSDWIYVLNNGRIIEQGSYFELKNKKHGALSEMLVAQLPEENIKVEM